MKGSGVCKFLGIILVFSQLVQGVCAAESTNIDSNDTIVRNTQTFSWVLLLPLFLGCLLFLGWVCRYFPEMTSCFVLFMLLLLLAVILLIGFKYHLVLLLTPLILLPLLYELYFETKEIEDNRGKTKENNSRNIKEDNDKIEDNFLKKARGINIIGAVLIWPATLVYFYLKDVQYVTFYGIDSLKFPVYIILASLIGVTSYILLSIEDTFNHLIPEYKKLSAVWSYLKRFLIAPFIAIVGFYLLNYLININKAGDIKNINDCFVFVFSFFAGVFTKTIEEWIYAWVQKLLPENSKKEFDSRILTDVTESDFVKKLGLDDDVAYMLYSTKIRTIDELAACEPKKLFMKLNRDIRNMEGEYEPFDEKTYRKRSEERKLSEKRSYSLESIKMYIKKAQDYLGTEKSELVKLGMAPDLAFKLYYFAYIKTLDDLKKWEPADVIKKICDCEKEAEELAKNKNIDIKEAYKELCGYSEDDIKKFKEKTEKLPEKS